LPVPIKGSSILQDEPPEIGTQKIILWRRRMRQCLGFTLYNNDFEQF
jgi:hypothetical protein